jgi:hypothetical protein
MGGKASTIGTRHTASARASVRCSDGWKWGLMGLVVMAASRKRLIRGGD